MEKFKRVELLPIPTMPLLPLTKEQRKQQRLRICAIIREARKAKGITLKQAGELFDVNESTMARHEKGRSAMSVDLMIALAAFYGIDTIKIYE